MEMKNQHHAGEKKVTGEIRVEKEVAVEQCGCSFHRVVKIGELEFFVLSTSLLFWARQVSIIWLCGKQINEQLSRYNTMTSEKEKKIINLSR